jgi:hypothetical protein
VDACTVTASDVTAAFATSGPNLLLAKLVGFFGSECLANRFALAITQPTSDWQRLIEAKPFGRRYKPDIGYAPAACSCERAGNVDACTVSACYVTIAFAISDPSALLAVTLLSNNLLTSSSVYLSANLVASDTSSKVLF